VPLPSKHFAVACLFALQDIPKDTILRGGKKGRNLNEFQLLPDIESVIQTVKDKTATYVCDNQPSNVIYNDEARLHYMYVAD
jgi:hypothetical protein